MDKIFDIMELRELKKKRHCYVPMCKKENIILSINEIKDDKN